MKKIHAKSIVAILTRETGLRDEIVESLQSHLGAADFIGKWHPFEHTSYYAPEMGDHLQRCIVSFEGPINPDQIGKIKSWTREIEDRFRIEGKRRVNIDPGYLDYHKVILASCKGGGHMILLGNDVYVDMLLWYNKGWQPLPWAYPDFHDGTYFEDLEEIRKIFKTQLP